MPFYVNAVLYQKKYKEILEKYKEILEKYKEILVHPESCSPGYVTKITCKLQKGCCTRSDLNSFNSEAKTRCRAKLFSPSHIARFCYSSFSFFLLCGFIWVNFYHLLKQILFKRKPLLNLSISCSFSVTILLANLFALIIQQV